MYVFGWLLFRVWVFFCFLLFLMESNRTSFCSLSSSLQTICLNQYRRLGVFALSLWHLFATFSLSIFFIYLFPFLSLFSLNALLFFPKMCLQNRFRTLMTGKNIKGSNTNKNVWVKPKGWRKKYKQQPTNESTKWIITDEQIHK